MDTVAEWLATHNIELATVTKLEDSGFVSLQAIKLLDRQLIDRHFPDVSLAQRLLLAEAVSKMKTEERRPAQIEDNALEDFNFPDLQIQERSSQEGATGKVRDLTTYVSLNAAVANSGSDGPLALGLVDGRITVAKKKVPLEKMSMPQYFEAALKIHEEMVEVDRIDTTTAQQYLGYVRRISQMAQVFTWQSILLFDREFRKEQAAKQLPWCTESAYLMTLLLRPLTQLARKPTQLHKTDATGRQICIRWNRGACVRSTCNYAHVCLDCLSPSHMQRSHTAGGDAAKNLA